MQSTASPFKFNQTVVQAIMGDEAVSGKSEFELLEIYYCESGMSIPKGLKDLDKRKVKHKTVCEKFEMKQNVLEILNIKNKK